MENTVKSLYWNDAVQGGEKECLAEVPRKRDMRIDNLRAVLMILVVAGHLMEVYPFSGSGFFYQLIYTFHMPGFALLSGMCWKGPQQGRLLKKQLYPYMVFQTLYLMQQEFILGGGKWSYTVPYWLMWYLFSAMQWELLAVTVPLQGRNGLISIAVSIVAALAVGYDSDVGYFLSVSRTFVMFPFFLAGAWYRSNAEMVTGKFGLSKTAGKALAIVGLAVCVVRVWSWQGAVSSKWLYHSCSYDEGYGVLQRFEFLVLAAVILAGLWVLMPIRQVKGLSYLGAHTMPVFLLHGFVLRWLNAAQILSESLHGIVVPVLTVALVCLLASPLVVTLTKPLMVWPFEKKGG